MAREMATEFAAAAVADVVYPVLMTEADFDSGSINLWSGYGTLSRDGKEYLGAGTLLQVGPAEETGTVEAANATFQLSGVQESDLAIALQENYQGRPIKMLLGLLDRFGDFVSEPIRLFKGKMDVMSINDDPGNPTIGMTAENDLIRLNRAKLHNRTHEDQQVDYPGDMFFEFVPAMQNKEIIWK